MYAGIFIRKWASKSYPFKDAGRLLIMHFNSINFILLALFSAALVHGQPVGSSPSNIPPGFTLAPLQKPSDPKIVYVNKSTLLPDLTGVVKTTVPNTWMHLVPIVDSATGRTVHVLSATNKNVKVVEDNPALTKPGHVALLQQDTRKWIHYPDGEHMVSTETFDKANEKAERLMIAEKRKLRHQYPPS